jgi:hypothetical protein
MLSYMTALGALASTGAPSWFRDTLRLQAVSPASPAVFSGVGDWWLYAPPRSWSSIMPRYFFHSQTETRATDEEGLELDGPLEARRQAIQTCGEMIRECPEGFWGTRPWSITVTDSSGLVLWEIYIDGVASAAAS